MAVVRLGRSVPLVTSRSSKAATTKPSVPSALQPGARVEVLHHGAWISATVLHGNFPGAAFLRVLLPDGAASSLARCHVRRPAPLTSRPPSVHVCAYPDVKRPHRHVLPAADDNASAPTIPKDVPVLAIPAPNAAPALPPSAASKKRSVESSKEVAGQSERKKARMHEPAPRFFPPSAAAPSKKRPVEPCAEAAGESDRKKPKAKPGPGMGISRAALEALFKEMKPLYPNAELPPRRVAS